MFLYSDTNNHAYSPIFYSLSRHVLLNHKDSTGEYVCTEISYRTWLDFVCHFNSVPFFKAVIAHILRIVGAEEVISYGNDQPGKRCSAR